MFELHGNLSPPVALSEAKEIARRAIAGKIPLLLACREIDDRIRGSKLVSHDILTTFTAISSECDGVPLGDERQY